MTGSTAASAAPGTSAAPSSRPAPATVAPPPAPPAADERPAATEDAPPPTPPEAVQTTVEELPAGFWDDDGPAAAPQGIAERRPVAPVQPVDAPAPSPRPASPRPTAPAADPGSGPAALASLQGLALVQAVFPGRVVKVDRSATADGDATPDEPPIDAPIDAPDDDLDSGADAPPPSTP